MPQYNTHNNPDRQNYLSDIYEQPHSIFHEIMPQRSFLADAPVEDWMTEGMESFYTIHTLLSAGTAPTARGPVHIMLYAQRREPLPHQTGNESYMSYWQNYNIEALNPVTGEYLAYTYMPKEYATSPTPEEVGMRRRLDSRDVQSFLKGVTFWHNAGGRNELRSQDVADLRDYLEHAQYDPDLAKKMVDLHLTRWPQQFYQPEMLYTTLPSLRKWPEFTNSPVYP